MRAVGECVCVCMGGVRMYIIAVYVNIVCM